jgi:Mg-chelatase subunit ChlD
MAPITNDVIGGFNAFIDEQIRNGADARMSIVQFDSQDPQDVTVWGAPLPEITHLDSQSFVPRGSTPLLDATGLLIGRTMVDQAARVAAGLQAEDIIFVTITDGEENQSREFNLAQIRELVEKRT